MSDDNSSNWSLNLDAKDAEASVNMLQKGLSGIGATDLSELTASLTEIGTVVGVVGAAVLAIGESFKLVMDAEAINAVNQQFDVLAKNAGLFGTNLKAALETSAGGLVDEQSLLKGASEAMVALGANSAKLPQIMTLARQATQVFGGDLMSNFNGIAQAIASGNTRMLKHLGIVVDQQAAYTAYAKSIGVATDELSEAGKQHAMMNAVLAQGQTAFAGVDGSLKVTTTAWQSFKAAMVDVGDSLTIVWGKIFGPTVSKGMSMLADSAKYLSNMLKSSLGTGSEAASASVENLTAKLATLQAKQAMLAKDAATNKLYDPALLASTSKEIDQVTAELAKQQAVVTTLGAQEKKNFDAGQADGKAQVQASEVNSKLRQQHQLEFQTNLDKLKKENDAAEIKSATSIAQVDAAAAARKIALVQATEDKIKKIKATEGLSDKQKEAMEVQINRQATLEQSKDDANLQNERLQALTNLENQNASTAGKVGNAWAAESQKAALQMQDFSKIATGSFQTVQSNADSAFEAMGDGSQSAGDAMKGFMFGSLGSIAESAGAVMLAEGVWPPNPVALAGGAALLVLGGFLKGQAKGGTSPSPPVSSDSSSSAPAAAADTSTPSTDSSSGPTTTQNPSASVSFVVQGNLYSSNEAKLEMMDIMRSATDATDYKYTQVGGS